jgi:hypothetical protein
MSDSDGTRHGPDRKSSDLLVRSLALGTSERVRILEEKTDGLRKENEKAGLTTKQLINAIEDLHSQKNRTDSLIIS